MCSNDTPNAPQLKQCSKCKELSPATPEYFSRHKREKDGLNEWCKTCAAEYNRAYRLANHERIAENSRAYHAANREHHNQQSRDYFQANKERARQIGRDYYKANKERWRVYFSANRDRINERRRLRRIRRRPVYAQIDGYKCCLRCKEYKPATLEYFSPRKDRSDGLRERCRVCYTSHRYTYYQANKERINEKTRAYSFVHPPDPEKRRVNKHRRRARLVAAEGSHTAEDIQAQYKRQKGKCYWCSKKVGKIYHVDHVFPLSRGGSDDASNLVIACPYCNISRGARLPSEWPQGNRLL